MSLSIQSVQPTNTESNSRDRSIPQASCTALSQSSEVSALNSSTALIDPSAQKLQTPQSVSQLDNQASSALRASIAKLEFLLHEAGRLAENVVSYERQESKAEEAQQAQNSSVEQKLVETELASATKANKTSKTLSRRTSALNTLRSPSRSIQSAASLPTIKSTAAAPLLSISEVKNAENAAWNPAVQCTDHDPRPEDIREHLHDWACPSSRRHSQRPTENLESENFIPTLPKDNSVGDSNEVLQFEVIHEHPSGQEERSTNLPSRKDFNSPTRVSDNRRDRPTLLVNGEQVQGWDEALVDKTQKLQRTRTGHERHYSNMFGVPSRQTSIMLNHQNTTLEQPNVNLGQRSNLDARHKSESFNVHGTCQHSEIARNWPNSRKRFTAFVACMNTCCIGLLLGIYAGEVPAIQYAIADFGHFSILRNVLMYTGLAISTLLLWPLPLLHGRKPYIIIAELFALALQVPQGLAVAGFRDPSTVTYKTLLLASRGVSGLALGLADMNLKATLLDCFGASLQSKPSELDQSNPYDVRKHGSGMGMWLGFVSWCAVGSISVGFMVGASVIDRGASVSWGFWISLCILLVALFLNIIAPEVRRSAFRRTVAEFTGVTGSSSRAVRGEINMHLTMEGPSWWGEEVMAGLRLCGKMIIQPGFLVLSVYAGWVYAQYNLVLMVSSLHDP